MIQSTSAGQLLSRANEEDQDNDTKMTRIKGTERQTKRSHLRLAKIKDRHSNTRSINERHVGLLAQSIASVGLIQSLAVDEDGVLLAGGHRLAAIRRLKDNNPEAFARWFDGELVPVTVINLEDADDRERTALSIEVSENEKRRDYTAGEITKLADRLREAGYREGAGRLGPGDKHLVPALALLLGKSLRTARRLLSQKSSAGKFSPNAITASLQRCQKSLRDFLNTIEVERADNCVTDELRDAIIKTELLMAQAIKSGSATVRQPQNGTNHSQA